MLTFDELLAKFGPARRNGKEWRVLCPAHSDSTPSLDISEGHSGPVFQCRSHHCSADDILAAMELTWSDVLPPRTNGHAGPPFVPDHVYDYCTRDGTLRYRVLRQDAWNGQPKKILQQAASGEWSLKGIQPLPYRLPSLVGPSVLVAEGEKTVDALTAAGFEATCNSGGAGKWRDSDTLALKEAGIKALVILPDNDAPGLSHAAVIEVSAATHGLTTRRAILPGLPPGGDAADWLQTHTADELEAALQPPPPPLLPNLADAQTVAAEGQKIAEDGIAYVVDGIIPDYGMLGFIVAAAKVGKSSLGLYLAECVATGSPFMEREVAQRKVLVIAAEDPPEYVAFLARHLQVPAGQITFSRAPIQLNAEGLELIVNTVKHGGYGLVLIASWQSVIATLVKDENDNAGSVGVVERVKVATRSTRIPWLVDAHAGKTEDQKDEADPTKALRGASAAAGAADFILSLRYVGTDTFSTQRRLSGKGRFVGLPPLVIDYDLDTGRYLLEQDTSKVTYAETTWTLIQETGALTDEWLGVPAIAVRAGLATGTSKVSGSAKRAIGKALHNRAGVDRKQEAAGDRTAWKFRKSQG
jgi:hypothetical protein